MRATTLAAVLPSNLLVLPFLAACSDGEPADPPAPVEVEMGEETIVGQEITR